MFKKLIEDYERHKKSNFWDENCNVWAEKKMDMINSRLSIAEEKISEHDDRNHLKWDTEENKF